jgi:hypothetical protein
MISLKRFDNFFLGLALGLLCPVIAMVLFFYFKADVHNLNTFWNFLIGTQILSKLISLCVIPNLLIFFLFIWTDKLISARGVVYATLFYAIVVFVVKFSIS